MSESHDTPQEQFNPIAEVASALNADVYLFSGPIYRAQSEMMLHTVEQTHETLLINGSEPAKNAALILTTYGGDPDAAFSIVRRIKAHYRYLTLYVFGVCKSSGTLIAVGADEIVMSVRGEFGPLDVQLLKTDEFIQMSSGLDIYKALEALSDQAFEVFEKHLLEIRRKSGGSVTTKTAADIASSMSVGLLSPITGQVDPFRLGEVQRSMAIAYEYGVRLGADANTLQRLITAYPSHSFVIDYEEARGVFPSVRLANPVEQLLERHLRDLLATQLEVECVREPHPSGIVAYLNPAPPESNDPSLSDAEQAQKGAGDSPVDTSAPELEAEAAEPEPSADGDGAESNGHARRSKKVRDQK